jgi:phosphopantothenoylcysteine synthetase/decarboxylase
VRPVLITAGATRNPIDSMRFISANASGRTGALLAEQLGPEGLTILGSPEALLRVPGGTAADTFGATEDLMARMKRWVLAHPSGVVIHSAAVGDYAVTDVSDAEKIPSGQTELTLRLHPTPKILDRIRVWSPAVFLVSFKAAAPDTTVDGLVRIATTQLQRTTSDLVFGNTIGAIKGPVVLVDASGAVAFDDRADGLNALLAGVIAAR